MNDKIYRQAAIDALMPIYKTASTRNRNVFSVARKCIETIESLPSAEPKKGKWVLHDGYYCTFCGYKLVTTAIPDRCPSCMADMKGVEA